MIEIQTGPNIARATKRGMVSNAPSGCRSDIGDRREHVHEPQTIAQIDHAASITASRSPEATFTGNVTLRGYFARAVPNRLAGATVAFAPDPHPPGRTTRSARR